MKKILALVAVVAMVAAMATACGNNTTSGSSVGSSTSVSESKQSEITEKYREFVFTDSRFFFIFSDFC